MDQGPLVTEMIEAGGNLVREFDRYAPLQAAFWWKDAETGEWFLQLASDRIDDTGVRDAYGEVNRLLGPGPHLWLTPFQVRVTGMTDRRAQAVAELVRKYPVLFPGRIRAPLAGNAPVADGYAYVLPAPVPA